MNAMPNFISFANNIEEGGAGGAGKVIAKITHRDVSDHAPSGAVFFPLTVLCYHCQQSFSDLLHVSSA